MPKSEQKILEALLNISNFVGSVMELDDILKVIVHLTSKAMSVPVCSIYLLTDEKPKELVLRSTSGLNTHIVGKARFKIGEGIPGWVAQHNQLLALDDGPKDPRFMALPGKSNEELLHAYLCVPLRIQEEVIGVMAARKKEVYHYTESEILVFETICKQVSIVIEKSRLYFQKIYAEKMAMVSMSLSEIAHYIKNILQGMEGGAWFVDRGLKSGNLEKAQNGWILLQKSTKKIGYLVENMLNYSRPINVSLERGNINALLVEILNSVVDTAAERHVEVHPELAQNLPDIYFDWDRMYDSILNLVSNAMDAILEEKTGLIILKSWFNKEKNRVAIEVIDNGTGIADENKEKIFLLFFSTKGHRGTGIGLNVTKKIIEEHGGKIWFESRGGEGTRFVMELPVDSRTDKK